MLGLGKWRAAAAPAQEPARPASMLPAIKCSNCGVDIEISQMGNHVCSPVDDGPQAPPTPAKEPLRKLQRAGTMEAAPSLNRKSSGFLRPGRQAPAMIDSGAANKPYSKPPANLLTPVSDYSNPRSATPATPRSGRRPPMRSATSPMPYSPPSPDIPIAQDSAFPVFPMKQKRGETPAGSKARSKSRERRKAAEESPYAPMSPRGDAGANILERMNTIKPGPFDGRRPSTSHGDHDNLPATTETRAASRASNGSNGSRKGHVHSNSLGSNGSRRSRNSNGLALPVNPQPRPKTPPPPRPARPDSKDIFEGIDSFLRRVQNEEPEPQIKPVSPDARSRTFPVRKDSRAGMDGAPTTSPRRPSEPGMRPRGLSNATVSSIYSADSEDRPPLPPMPDLTSFPPRGASRNGFRPERPIAPPAVEALRSPDSALHTPSDSASSAGSLSGFDAHSVSSMSSAPGSEVGSLTRKPSKPANFPSEFSKARQAPIEAPLEIAPLAVQPKSVEPPMPESRPYAAFHPTTGISRPNAPEDLPSPPAMISPIPEAPESPMDPAIQRGLISQRRSKERSKSPPKAMSQSPPRANSRSRSPPRALTSHDGRLPPPPPIPMSPPEVSPAESTISRRTTTKKGKCRGCGELITGKSVKSADGNLTGRWHKECFTCKTCREPFQTGSDFYVHNNLPYCEHHYHQVNGSLCQACNRGIEGQYLETDQQKKFHPRCFTCFHCRAPLRDDYFELGGKPYCERHAYHAAQKNKNLGPGRRFPERRTTRLMMMNM